MKIIAVMTQKGGVGKTMTASSLAYILGAREASGCSSQMLTSREISPCCTANLSRRERECLSYWKSTHLSADYMTRKT